MTRPYSEDIRERALARADAGGDGSFDCRSATDQSLLRDEVEESAARYRGPVAWQDRRPQETGSVECQCRLAAQAHSLGAIHLAQADPGAGRTRHQDRRAGGVDFCSHRGAELQKKRSIPPNKTVPTSSVNGPAGRRIKAGSRLRAWCSSTRRGSKPTWRRCAAGDLAGSASKHLHRSAIGRP